VLSVRFPFTSRAREVGAEPFKVMTVEAPPVIVMELRDVTGPATVMVPAD